MDVPVLVINLNRSEDRLANVIKQLGSDSFIRIEAKDGREWESGEVDRDGRPKWKNGIKKQLREDGILSKIKLMELIPCEVACALSHKKAWEYMIENKIDKAVILEDDFELTDLFIGSFIDSINNQKGSYMDADVVFLSGKDAKYSMFKLDKKNKVLSGQCNTGYLITLEGAKKAIHAQFPMSLPCDIQWWRVAFKDIERPLLLNVVERGYAYAVKKSIVISSPYNNISTMTPSGKKPWQLKKDD